MFAADVESLAHLITRLRNERGLTQKRLAADSGIDSDTIAKVEMGRSRTWRPRTARAILEAIHAAGPLSESDVATYAHHTGLRAVVLPRNTPEGFKPARAIVTQEQVESRARDLIARFGVEYTQRLFEVLLAAPAVDQDERLITVAHPEVQRDLGGGVHAIEQRRTYYDVAKIPPPLPAEQRKRKPG